MTDIAERTPASFRLARGTVLSLTLGFACMFFYDGRRSLIFGCALGFLASALLLKAQRQIVPSALMLFYAVALAFRLFPPALKVWPLFYVIPLAFWGATILSTGSWPALADGFSLGFRNGITLILSAISIVVPAVVLELWARSNGVYLHGKAAQVPHLSPLLLYPAGAGFAAVNAVLEELAFRGIIQGGLKKILGKPLVVVPLQAIVFGAAHIAGVPGGTSGVLLASLYGLFLGLIRESSGGLLWPILTHIFADAVIFSILIHSR